MIGLLHFRERRSRQQPQALDERWAVGIYHRWSASRHRPGDGFIHCSYQRRCRSTRRKGFREGQRSRKPEKSLDQHSQLRPYLRMASRDGSRPRAKSSNDRRASISGRIVVAESDAPASSQEMLDTRSSSLLLGSEKTFASP